jgi:hypothetical protein
VHVHVHVHVHVNVHVHVLHTLLGGGGGAPHWGEWGDVVRHGMHCHSMGGARCGCTATLHEVHRTCMCMYGTLQPPMTMRCIV